MHLSDSRLVCRGQLRATRSFWNLRWSKPRQWLSRPNGLITTLTLTTMLGACATVPETGRSQLLLISPEQESQLGVSEFSKLKKSTPASTDRAQTAQLQRVPAGVLQPASAKK